MCRDGDQGADRKEDDDDLGQAIEKFVVAEQDQQRADHHQPDRERLDRDSRNAVAGEEGSAEHADSSDVDGSR